MLPRRGRATVGRKNRNCRCTGGGCASAVRPYVIRDRAIPSRQAETVQRRILWSCTRRTTDASSRWRPSPDIARNIIRTRARFRRAGRAGHKAIYRRPGQLRQHFHRRPPARPRYMSAGSPTWRGRRFHDDLTEFVPSTTGRNQERFTAVERLAADARTEGIRRHVLQILTTISRIAPGANRHLKKQRSTCCPIFRPAVS